jgi:RNA 2',3'-cyclic 3'-phosphodiesterase
VRLFVALELPGGVRAALAEWGSQAAAGDPALRAIGADALHLTLAFLGERGQDDVGPLRVAVRGCATPVGALSLGEALWLAPRRPHVLTVAVHDADAALARMQACVVAALAEAVGFAAEDRRFRPHVTVARVRRGARPRREALPPLPAARPAVFAGEALTLMRSHLSPSTHGPARYEALERVSLQG